MKWFRYYDEALDDPKVQRLSGDAFKAWINLLCLASKNEGKLPSVDDISFRLRISVQDAQQRIDDLVLAGLIDILPDKSMTPHNWSLRQFQSDTSALRMQKMRANKRNKIKESKKSDVTSDGCDEKSYALDTDTDTEKEPLLSPLPEAKPQPAANSLNVTANSPAAELERVSLGDGGVPVLHNGLKAFWLGEFAGDANSLNLALIQAAGYVQPNSSRPLEAQVSAQLARMARETRESTKRYLQAAKTRPKIAREEPDFVVPASTVRYAKPREETRNA